MCILCIEIEKERLLPEEALRNYIEISPSLDDAHNLELFEKISKLFEKNNHCIWCQEEHCACEENGWD